MLATTRGVFSAAFPAEVHAKQRIPKTATDHVGIFIKRLS
jgi:hypothetical protein